ncbi:DNA-binding response regulator [Streptomyces sp. NPDC005917]|uniref:response regulator transcription factor n=1 Tax=unclassified Streptomyces TaxID=2593676 RepID=UPI0033EA2497
MKNAIPPAALRRPDGSPVRVRVVDDEPDLTEVLAQSLRHERCEVRSAGDGASAVATARAFDFGGQAHAVELYISYLRKKIDAGRTPLIHTVRGVGYVLEPEAS